MSNPQCLWTRSTTIAIRWRILVGGLSKPESVNINEGVAGAMELTKLYATSGWFNRIEIGSTRMSEAI